MLDDITMIEQDAYCVDLRIEIAAVPSDNEELFA